MARKAHADRTAARCRAFQALYSFDFAPASTLEDLRRTYTAMPNPNDEAALAEENAILSEPLPTDFAWNIVEGVWNHAPDLDNIIAHFSRHWRIDRVGRIEITLLRMALFEMLYSPLAIPPKVAIDEALDLSTRFADDKAKRFINGILDAVVHSIESGDLSSLKQI